MWIVHAHACAEGRYLIALQPMHNSSSSRPLVFDILYRRAPQAVCSNSCDGCRVACMSCAATRSHHCNQSIYSSWVGLCPAWAAFGRFVNAVFKHHRYLCSFTSCCVGVLVTLLLCRCPKSIVSCRSGDGIHPGVSRDVLCQAGVPCVFCAASQVGCATTGATTEEFVLCSMHSPSS